MLGALFSAGASLLGGLFSNNSRKREQARAEQAAKDAAVEQRASDAAATAEMRAFDADAPRRNIMSQLEGVEQGAKELGYNRLTLLQGGQTGGGGSSGFARTAAVNSPPPLASVDLLTGALQDFGDIASGEAARRDAANKLQMDLGQLKLDQLRSGVVAFAPSATAAVGDGLPALGRRAATVVPESGPKTPARLVFPTSRTAQVEQKSVVQRYVTSSGETIDVPVGSDLDEMISGAAIEGGGYVKSRARPYVNVDGFSLSRAFDTFGSFARLAVPALRSMPTRDAVAARKTYKNEPYTPFARRRSSPTKLK